MQKHEIVILIPCFNEEKTIIKICKKAKKFGKILIIDDKSTDKSAILLRKEKINFYFLGRQVQFTILQK